MNTKNDNKGPEILWAPWRIEYVAAPQRIQEEGCVFCSRPAEKKDKENLIVHRGQSVFVILNRFPYNNGHLLVVPFRHTADFTSLCAQETAECMFLLQQCQAVITELMSPQGFNIGLNLGTAGGAGIRDHLHFHLVPRWQGDTNFMPVTGQVKVVSEALEMTRDRLAAALSARLND